MVAPGVHLIEVPLGARRNTVYLIEGDRSLLLFDTGIAGQLERYLVPYLAGIGRRPDEISHVILSHCDIDHWGGAADARRLAPGAMLLAHAADSAQIGDTARTIADRYQEFVRDHGIGWSDEFVDRLYERSAAVVLDGQISDGETIDLGGRRVEMLHVPGHSRGHLAAWDATSSSLIAADAILGDGVPDAAGVPSMPPNYRYPRQYRATCQRLEELRPRWLLTAHFEPMSGADAARFVESSAGYCDFVENELSTGLESARTATTIELVRLLQPILGPWPLGEVDFGVASMLVGHLEEFAAAGRVDLGRNDDGHVVWGSVPRPTNKETR